MEKIKSSTTKDTKYHKGIPSCTLVSLVVQAFCALLLFRRQGQPKHRNHSLSGHIDLGLRRLRQVQCLAMLAAVDLGIRTPRLLRVPASPLQYVNGIEPPLQVPTAELSLFIFLVARTLPRLLNLDLMMRKLRRSFSSRGCDFARRQCTYPQSRGARAADFALRATLYPKI
jgi:hypothetical protein